MLRFPKIANHSLDSCLNVLLILTTSAYFSTRSEHQYCQLGIYNTVDNSRELFRLVFTIQLVLYPGDQAPRQLLSTLQHSLQLGVLHRLAWVPHLYSTYKRYQSVSVRNVLHSIFLPPQSLAPPDPNFDTEACLQQFLCIQLLSWVSSQ